MNMNCEEATIYGLFQDTISKFHLGDRGEMHKVPDS